MQKQLGSNGEVILAATEPGLALAVRVKIEAIRRAEGEVNRSGAAINESQLVAVGFRMELDPVARARALLAIPLQRGNQPSAFRLARGAAELMGRHLAWPIQIMRADCIRVCGPMAPVFDRVKESFKQGLSALLTAEEIKRLDPSASPAREQRFLRGAHRLARRLFTHPDDYELLLRTPASLDIRA